MLCFLVFQIIIYNKLIILGIEWGVEKKMVLTLDGRTAFMFSIHESFTIAKGFNLKNNNIYL